MAATKRNAMLIEEARKKIQTTQLVKRLTAHAFGEVQMSPTQVTAALGLLRKSLPDLTSMQHSGEIATGVMRVPEVSPSTEQWERQHSPKTIQ